MVRGHDTSPVGSDIHSTGWHRRRNDAGLPTHTSDVSHLRFHRANGEGCSSSGRHFNCRSSSLPPPPPHHPRVPQPLEQISAGEVYKYMSLMLAMQHAQEEELRTVQLELRNVHHAVANIVNICMETMGILKPDIPEEVVDDDQNEPRWRP